MAAVTDNSYELRSNAVGTADVAAMSIGGMSPTLGIALSTPIMAASIGIAVPFAYVLGTIGVLAAAYGVLVFSRRSNAHGVAFSYIGAVFGKAAGFVAGWLHSGAWLVLVPVVDAIAAVSLQAFLQSAFSVSVSWFPLFLGLLVLSFLLSYYGVRLSVRSQMILELGSMAFIAAVMLVVIVKGGSTGLSAAPFNPSNAPKGLTGIGFGLLFAFSSFQGWEAGAALGKEAKTPRRSLPRGLIGAILVSAVFFLITSYAMAIGYGAHDAAAWGKDLTPLGTISGRFTNSGIGSVTNLLVAISAFSDGLAGLALTSRVYHSMSSAGLGLKWLRRTHKRYQTPYGGLILTLAIALICGLVIGLPAGEQNMVGILAGANTIAFQIVYLAIAVAAIWLFLGKVKTVPGVLLRYVVPVVAILLLGYAVYGSTWPPPVFPLNLAAPAFLLWLLIGVVLAYLVRKRGAAPNLETDASSAEKEPSAAAEGA